jgi:hypothetical protein
VELAAKKGKMLRGRQALFLVYQWYRVTEESGALFNLRDLMKWEGDSIASLTSFQQNWTAVLNGMKEDPGNQTKATLYHLQIHECSLINHDIEIYDRAPIGDPNHTYDYLYKAVKSKLARTRMATSL